MKITILSAFMLLNSISYAQTAMTSREAFFYSLRANNIRPDEKINLGFGHTYQWFDFYASYFENDNYKKASQDEFQRKPYLTRIYNEMTNGIKAVNLNKTFSLLVQMPVGIYNSDCGCFPLNKDDFLSTTPNLLTLKEFGNFRISVGDYFNFNDFDFILKMKSPEAEKFIASRKDSYGKINRNIIIKIIYNVTDKIFENKAHQVYVGVYIHRLEFYDGTIRLSEILPENNYFDKVKLVKIKDGIDKTFFNENWEILNQQSSINASFFRTTTYKDGKKNGSNNRLFYQRGKANDRVYH